jgi:hypothetical protein
MLSGVDGSIVNSKRSVEECKRLRMSYFLTAVSLNNCTDREQTILLRVSLCLLLAIIKADSSILANFSCKDGLYSVQH